MKLETDVIGRKFWGINIEGKNNSLDIDEPHISIGRANLGDLTDIKDRDELNLRYETYYSGERNKFGALARFLFDMKIGDYVIYPQSEPNVINIGRVTSDYYYKEPDDRKQTARYPNHRAVEWIVKKYPRSKFSEELYKVVPNRNILISLDKYEEEIMNIIKDGDYTAIDKPYNRISFGAPGTGKSFKLEQERMQYFPEESQYERVTFQPAYSYSQFVGAFKPTSKKIEGEQRKEIEYSFVPGPFIRLLLKALTHPNKNYLLMIEEINRADTAAVFGDVFQLLDREHGESDYAINISEDLYDYLMNYLTDYLNEVEGPIYSTSVVGLIGKKKMKLPANLYIWATMNSADQGVFPMDTAFKRRWEFEYCGIDDGEDKIPETGEAVLIDGQEIKWNPLRKAINDFLSSDKCRVNEDKLMGPFFISRSVIEKGGTALLEAIKSKVLMYLFEDGGRSKRQLIFKNLNRYSDIKDKFGKEGLKIFNEDISEKYQKYVQEK